MKIFCKNPFPRIIEPIPLILIFTISSIFIILFSSFFFINDSLRCQKHITNNFGYVDSSTNLSHILFGIAGSTKTWNNRRHYVELWWKPNHTRCVVWLDKEPPKDQPWPDTSPPYMVSANTSMLRSITRENVRVEMRLARVVFEMYRLGLEDNVRWFVLGDDDTVFFPENLVTVLSRYDWQEMRYVGGVSESVDMNVVLSYEMAHGGGGIAVSRPLAAELARIMDGCLRPHENLYGSDARLWACVTELGVSLSKELGFHQMDIRGDASGLLAAHPPAPLVSLHHLDWVSPIDPRIPNRVDSLSPLLSAYRADPGRALQQTICYEKTKNWSVSVSWAYTAHIHPWIVQPWELLIPTRTFTTWSNSSDDGPFTFNTRPVGRDPCERPLVYFLDRVEEVEGGPVVTTSYSRFRPGQECGRAGFREALKVETVRVVSTKMGRGEWRKVS
ncbi:hypothetical protein QJS04_geneDACA007740 [Acorus gramineus]|uniref:Uncharacterized protein n=1 Tax=Acorus gramineus TaxID=55184 RepID=A0AAV9B5G1_ACOGR|nr:hypothetical protein QJS04_geneDACA007740 [Acorus gramineus]